MKFVRFGCALALIGTMLLTGCGGGGGGGGGEATPAMEKTVVATKTVGSEGGTVQVTDAASSVKGASVAIPAGALPSSAAITIASVKNPPALSETQTPTMAVDFGPSGTTFSAPVTITIPYDSSKVTDPAGFQVYTYNESKGYWDTVKTVSVDTANHTVTAVTDHFSIYAAELPTTEMKSTLYQRSDGYLAASVKIIPKTLITYGGYTNIPDYLPQKVYRYLIDSDRTDLDYTYTVVLMKYNPSIFVKDEEVEIKTISYHQGTNGFPQVFSDVKATVNGTPFTLFHDIQPKTGILNMFNYYSGEPVLLVFDKKKPTAGENYYIKVILEAKSYAGYGGKFLSFDGSKEKKATFAAMTTVDYNENGIHDTYDPKPAPTYSISGQVIKSGLAGYPGVTVTAGGKQATSDIGGFYTISGLPSGNYTVTASYPGYTLSSPQNVTINTTNVTDVNFVATPTPPATYSIKGTVTLNGAPLSGVTVSTAGGSATTDSSGSYAISGLANGSYTVTASKSGYTLSASQSVTISNADQTGNNFIATPVAPTSFSISGRVTTATGAPVSGVTISATGGAYTYSDSNGYYTLSDLPNGNYVVQTALSGYTMSSNQIVGVNGANVSDINFKLTYSVSGKVTFNGAGLAGVTITLTETSQNKHTKTTDANGNYSFTGMMTDTIYLEAKREGYSFSPTGHNVTVDGANISGQNFTATNSGTITVGW